MNSSPDLGPTEPTIPPFPGEPTAANSMNWRHAFMELIANRFALIQLESKDLATRAFKRGIMVALVAGCLVATWILLLAGGVAWIAEASGLHWSRVAILAALFHLLLGVILARLAARPLPPSFSATRNEFQKDREWIENFHTTKKSSN
jgi:uncharacterized membrane protein YqjE